MLNKKEQKEIMEFNKKIKELEIEFYRNHNDIAKTQFENLLKIKQELFQTILHQYINNIDDFVYIDNFAWGSVYELQISDDLKIAKIKNYNIDRDVYIYNMILNNKYVVYSTSI